MTFKNRLFQWLDRLHYRHILMQLCKDGLQIHTVYDIGAHKGRWTKEHARIFPQAKFWMFEANEEHAEKLKTRGHPFFIGVLSSRSELLRFYKKAGTGDSLYRENTDHYNEASFIEVHARPLSDVVREKGLPNPDFIKLDVQGAELDILEGASALLPTCALLLLECPLVPYNIGAPDLQTYLNKLKQLGFSPLRITEQHSDAGLLLQMDILFLQDKARERLYRSSALLKSV